MLDLLISSAIALLLSTGIINSLLVTANAYKGLQVKIAYLNARLTARFYLSQDIKISHNAYILDKTNLVLHQDQIKIIYSIRKSIIPIDNHMHNLSLYRSTNETLTAALVEGIVDFKFNLQGNLVKITLMFKDNSTEEIICAMRRFKE